MLTNMETKAANKEVDDAAKAEEYKKLMAVKRAHWGTDVAPDLELDPAKLKAAMETEARACATSPLQTLRGRAPAGLCGRGPGSTLSSQNSARSHPLNRPGKVVAVAC